MYSWKNRSFAFIYFVAIVLFSCREDRETVMFYNVDSLLTAQSTTLTARKAKLHKEAFVGSDKDDTLYTPGSAEAWKQELEAFTRLRALNQRVSRTSYIIDDSLFDPSSNLTVKSISAVEDLPVKYLRIFYDENKFQPRRIEALYEDRNEMYETAKILSMEFQKVNDVNILTGYTIQGGQKMMMADSVTYVVRGKIVIE